MYGISPHSTGLCPLLGLLPKKKRVLNGREEFDEMESQGRWRLDISSAVKALPLNRFMRLFKLFFHALHCIFNGSLTATIYRWMKNDNE